MVHNILGLVLGAQHDKLELVEVVVGHRPDSNDYMGFAVQEGHS